MAQWETLSKQDDGWEDIDGWETVEPKTTLAEDTGNLLSAFGKSAKSKIYDASRNIALGTVGLPSLGVDKLVGAVTGDEDYANPVTKYIAGMVEESDRAQAQAAEDAKKGTAGFVGSTLGSVAGMVPDMFMGGAGTSGMKTMTGAADQALPAIIAAAQKGFGSAQPLAANVGLGRYEEALDKGHDAGTAATAGLGSYGSMAVQGMAPMGAAGNIGKRIATGAVANVPLGIAGRQLENVTSPTNMQQDLYDPKAMIADAALGATMHGVMGERGGPTPESANLGRKPDLSNPDIERGLIEQGYNATKRDLKQHTALYDEIVARIESEGDVTPETIQALQEIELGIKKYQEEIANYETLLGGKQETNDAKTAEAINKQREKLDQLERDRAMREPGKGAREVGPHEDVPLPDRVPDGWEEMVDVDTGEVTPTLKKSPHEIALERIGEATGDPVLAAKRMQEAQDRLNNLPKTEYRDDTPGSHYSSIKAALEAEVKAYTDIVKGNEPNLDSFKESVTPEPTVDRAALIAEARAKSQAALEQQQQAAGQMPPDPRNEEAPKSDQSGLVKQAERPQETAEYNGWVPRMDEIVGFHPKGRRTIARIEINKLEKQLDAITQQRENAPIGTFDEAGAAQRQARLELQKARWEAIESHAVEQMQSRGMQDTLVQEDAAVKEANEAAVTPTKYDSIDDIVTATKNDAGDLNSETIRGFDDNPELFNTTQGKKIHFDKRIAEQFGPRIQKIFSHLLDKTRLGNEKVFFIPDGGMDAVAQVEFVGNTTIIKLNFAKIQTNLNRVVSNKLFKNIVGEGKLAEVIRDYNMARFGAHEIGHAMFTKYLRDNITHNDDLIRLGNDWQKHKEKNPLYAVSSMDVGAEKKRSTYQKDFTEFFSERVARNLMLKHVLGAFDNRSKSYLADVHKVIATTIKYLEDKGVDLNKKDFADEILQDILNDSNNYIKQMGTEAAYRVSILNNDKLIFQHKATDPDAFPFHKTTLEQALNKHYDMDIPDMYADKGFNIELAMKDPDIVPMLSLKGAVAMGHGFARNFFGKIGVAKVFRDNPHIQKIYQSIRGAERYANDVNNRLWFGEVTKGEWDKQGFINKMSKTKMDNSAHSTLEKATDQDLGVVHDLFRKGFEDELDYVDNYNTNGTHLTKTQKHLYDTLSELFNKQYEEVVRLEQDVLQKKNIMNKRTGWYPSVRAGQFFVDISYNGRTLHREHFRSKVEADHFRKNMKQSGYKNVIVSDAQHMKDNETVTDMYGGLELAQRILEQKFPQAKGAIRQTIEQALEGMITKGGKLGSHHQFRSNLPGYRGTELFYKPDEKGNSFRAAIQQSVNDYTGAMRKMIIQHEVDPILKTSGLDPEAPATKTMQTMVDSALGRVSPNALEKVDRTIIELWDGMMKQFTGEIKANQKDSFERAHNRALEFFYLTKLMAKLTFPISQVMGAAGAIRELSYSGGYYKPYIGMGKAVGKLLTGNKELMDVLYDASQKTNSLEPQFIESLHLSGDKNAFMEAFKDWALLRKPNEVADTFSRTLTFSAAYEMYRSMGMGRHTAMDKALADTDSTMVAYGRTETAPIFNKMGIAGQAMKPLQTFGQQSLANFVSDFRHMLSTNPKDWAPMFNYVLVMGMLGGAVSPIMIQEYELFRKIMENYFPDWAPPSVLDLAKYVPNFLDTVGVDEDMFDKAIQYGLPAALTGVDLASSLRSNQTFLTMVGAIAAGEEAWYQLLPHLSTIVKAAHGGITAAKGAITGNTTPAEMRTSLSAAMPSGAFSYGAKELAGVNTTSNFGKDTGMIAGGKEQDAQIKRGPNELIAGFMGTKSTEEKYQGDILRQRLTKEKAIKAQVDKQYELAIATGNQRVLEERIKKLVELGEKPETINSRLSSSVFKNSVPALTRLYANKDGNVADTMKNARTLQELGQFGRY